MPSTRPIRRTQLISSFGIGAMVDLPKDESLMVAGLDAWPQGQYGDSIEWQVSDERLARRLGVRSLRLPPDFREEAGTQYSLRRIPAVRFPRWHYCPRCGAMECIPLLRGSRTRCSGKAAFFCSTLRESQRPFLIPVRLAAVCSLGHIEDFPFDWWAHSGPSEGHQLKYEAFGSSASLSGIAIRCMDCAAQRTLAGSFDYDEVRGGPLARIKYHCGAGRPWLGKHDERGTCSEHLRVLQRGASNVYFPYTISSIYLPLWGEDTDPAVIRILDDPLYWDLLTGGLIDGSHVDEVRANQIAAHRGVNPDALRSAAQRKLDGSAARALVETETEYRNAEYEAFLAGRGDEKTDLMVQVIERGRYDDALAMFVRRVCLLRKLRETRAFAGFTRLLPPEGPRDPRIQQISNDRVDWLPAMVVRGEGLFIEFDEVLIDRWEQQVEVQQRARTLADVHNRRRRERGLVDRAITPRFLFLHTIAHLLIKQLSFDCGYGSASLRERIYSATTTEGRPMNGLLIYTASGDSEGTLGGLVRQGEPGRLEPIVFDAVRGASWCSSDPVCIESTGQGVDSANLAACHGCVLLSETSCEEGNRILDRGTVTGTIQLPSIGFLSSLGSLQHWE